MGLNELRKELAKNADKQADAIIDEAKANAKAITSSAEKTAKEMVAKAETEGKALAVEEARKVSSARVRAKHIESQSRENVLAVAFKQLRTEVAKTPSKKKDYERLFNVLLERALSEVGKDATVHCRSADASLAKKLAGKVESIDCLGGLRAVSKEGTVIVDYTLDALLEDYSDELRSQMYQELFD